jgi:ubiquinone/menaquinone biosynthesis C-methylase UbiE
MRLQDSSKDPKKSEVAEHWSQGEDMGGKIEEMLKVLNVDESGLSKKERLERAAKVDHFHGGGIETTEALRNLMEIPASNSLRGADIGSGIGGPMRWFAEQTGNVVDGVDITPEFVEISNQLSDRLGFGDKCTSKVGDATNIPLQRESYDFAVAMALTCNITNRPKFYGSLARILKPGGIAGMMDIIKGPRDGLVTPVPWSRDGSDSISLLLTEDETIASAGEQELKHLRTRDVSAEVLTWFEKESEEIAAGRAVGFEKFLPDWEKMVESQIQNLKNEHVKFMCLVFEK